MAMPRCVAVRSSDTGNFFPFVPDAVLETLRVLHHAYKISEVGLKLWPFYRLDS